MVIKHNKGSIKATTNCVKIYYYSQLNDHAVTYHCYQHQ